MNDETIYPAEVLDVSERVFESVFADGEFFKENDIRDEELGKIYAKKQTLEFFLKKFIDGANLTFVDEDEVLHFLGLVNAECVLRSLESKGILDSLADPDKDGDIFFLTQKGKMVVEGLRKLEDD
jgi:hypothetical protein